MSDKMVPTCPHSVLVSFDDGALRKFCAEETLLDQFLDGAKSFLQATEGELGRTDLYEMRNDGCFDPFRVAWGFAAFLSVAFHGNGWFGRWVLFRPEVKDGVERGYQDGYCNYDAFHRFVHLDSTHFGMDASPRRLSF